MPARRRYSAARALAPGFAPPGYMTPGTRQQLCCCSKGCPARVAMQVLGHGQIGLTLGTCSHVVPELATEAAERTGVALWS